MDALMCGGDLEVGFIVLTVPGPIMICLQYFFKVVYTTEVKYVARQTTKCNTKVSLTSFG